MGRKTKVKGKIPKKESSDKATNKNYLALFWDVLLKMWCMITAREAQEKEDAENKRFKYRCPFCGDEHDAEEVTGAGMALIGKHSQVVQPYFRSLKYAEGKHSKKNCPYKPGSPKKPCIFEPAKLLEVNSIDYFIRSHERPENPKRKNKKTVSGGTESGKAFLSADAGSITASNSRSEEFSGEEGNNKDNAAPDSNAVKTAASNGGTVAVEGGTNVATSSSSAATPDMKPPAAGPLDVPKEVIANSHKIDDVEHVKVQVKQLSDLYWFTWSLPTDSRFCDGTEVREHSYTCRTCEFYRAHPELMDGKNFLVIGDYASDAGAIEHAKALAASRTKKYTTWVLADPYIDNTGARPVYFVLSFTSSVAKSFKAKLKKNEMLGIKRFLIGGKWTLHQDDTMICFSTLITSAKLIESFDNENYAVHEKNLRFQVL